MNWACMNFKSYAGKQIVGPFHKVTFAGENGRGPGVVREWILLQFQGMLTNADTSRRFIDGDGKIVRRTVDPVFKHVEFPFYGGTGR